ncbi:MAG TPA: hypothetical protein VFB96_00980 [Pirellulaceae bacterium]|nr:hypothetical protein [Pirellulaceae bacterium]
MLSSSGLLSRNDFAQAVLDRLRQLGASVIPRYDELSFAFFVDVSASAATGASGHLRLEQWYERYKEALLDGRGQRAIDDLAHHWVQLLKHAEAKYALDTSRMIPLLRSRFDFAVTALRGEADGRDDTPAAVAELAWRPFNDHLVVALAEDLPNAWRHVTQTQLSHARMTWEAALALAMKNLPRIEQAFRNPSPFVHSEGNTWVPSSRQSPHNASWLLWPEALRSLPVAGQHVAFAPFTHTLAITGTENYPELARLAATTLSLAKTITDKPLTAVPLILDGNQWQPWLPPQTHPLHSTIRELWCLHENSLYSEQQKLLKRKAEGQEDAPYFASYKIFPATSSTGQRRFGTMALWTESVDTSLPKVDAVGLMKLLNREECETNENAEPKFGERVLISWQDLANYLGPRLKAQGTYPERYLVSATDFPMGPQWEGLALAEVDFPGGNWEDVPEVPSPPGAAPSLTPVSPLAPPTLGAAPAAPRPAPSGLLGAFPPLSPVVSPAPAAPKPAPQIGSPAFGPVPASPNLAPSLPPSAPVWQLPSPASKQVPLAPTRRRSVWPVLLVVAIPVAALFLLLLSVTLVIFWSRSPSRPTIAQQIHQAGGQSSSTRQAARLLNPPADIQAPQPRLPKYIIKLPWTEIEEFPPLGKPEVPLPRLTIQKDDVSLAGRVERVDRNDRFQFVDEAPPGGWLVGFRIVRGYNWEGAIRSLQPIYQVENEYHLGKLCGAEQGEAQTQVLAKPGYAVGKIECRAGLVNNALLLTFYRVKEQRLDPDDSYSTNWLGSDGGGPQPVIAGRGEVIVGVAGNYHADDDIISLQGLVALPLPKVEKSLPKSTGTARIGPSTDARGGSRAGDQTPEGGWLVGMRVYQGQSWGGAPQAIQPIYQVEDRYILGTRLGREGGELHEWIAPPGYAVGEIWADQGLVVHRLQLRYQRVSGAEMDTKDSEDSPRLGPQGGEQHCLSSDGKPIVGLNVELGHDISTLGIIVSD